MTSMHIPFELKDEFKKRFPRARWLQIRRHWQLSCDEYIQARAWLKRRQAKPKK